MLNAALAALAFLHENRLVHGAVDPAHITAFGDTNQAAERHDPAGGRRRFAGGRYAVARRDAARTAHTAAAGVDGETDSADLPEPFATIVRNTLKQDAAERWRRRGHRTVSESAAARRRSWSRRWNPGGRWWTARRHAPVAPRRYRAAASDGGARGRDESLPFQRSVPTRASTPAERGFPMKWVPIAGLVAAVGLGVVHLAKAGAGGDAAVVPVTRPVQSADRTVAPTPRVAAPAKPAVAPNPSAIWRVVAYTYNSRGAAEKKARSINEKRAAVARGSVRAARGTGRRITCRWGKDDAGQAERLQKEARSKGLPRDTFVRNFSNEGRFAGGYSSARTRANLAASNGESVAAGYIRAERLRVEGAAYSVLITKRLLTRAALIGARHTVRELVAGPRAFQSGGEHRRKCGDTIFRGNQARLVEIVDVSLVPWRGSW